MDRSSHQRCSVKKGVLRNFAKCTGKHLCQRLFFNKVTGLSPLLTGLSNFIKKEALAQVFSCEFCEIFKNTYFYRTPLVAASDHFHKTDNYLFKSKGTALEILIILDFKFATCNLFENKRWFVKIFWTNTEILTKHKRSIGKNATTWFLLIFIVSLLNTESIWLQKSSMSPRD